MTATGSRLSDSVRDTRIERLVPLVSPRQLIGELPMTEAHAIAEAAYMIRAGRTNREMVQSLGIDIQFLYRVVFAAGVAIATNISSPSTRLTDSFSPSTHTSVVPSGISARMGSAPVGATAFTPEGPAPPTTRS